MGVENILLRERETAQAVQLYEAYLSPPLINAILLLVSMMGPTCVYTLEDPTHKETPLTRSLNDDRDKNSLNLIPTLYPYCIFIQIQINRV